MAAQTCTWTGDAGAPFNWSDDGNWSTTDEEDRVPEDGDSVIFNNAVDCTVDEDTAALALLNMTGYTGTLSMGTNDIDVDGNMIYDGSITGLTGAIIAVSGTFQVETGGSATATHIPDGVELLLDGVSTIACFGINAGKIVVNSAGAVNAANKMIGSSLDLQAATSFSGGGFGGDFAGDILNSGTIVWTDIGTIKMTADGNAENDNRATFIPTFELGDGVECTLVDNLWIRNFIAADDATLTGGDFYLKTRANAAGWWDVIDAVINSNLETESVTSSPGNDIILQNKTLRFLHLGVGTLTMDANINTNGGMLHIQGQSAGDIMTLDMNGFAFRNVGDLVLGQPGANTGAGIIKCGGAAHSIASLAKGNAANSGNKIYLENCYLQCSGTIDLDNIIASATADNVVHIEGLGTGGITNADVDPGVLIHCHNLTDMGGDAHENYTFDKYTPPNSMALTGIGI